MSFLDSYRLAFAVVVVVLFCVVVTTFGMYTVVVVDFGVVVDVVVVVAVDAFVCCVSLFLDLMVVLFGVVLRATFDDANALF